MNRPTDAEPTGMHLRQARESLLDGRGPGASDEEVAAHTRNRVMIGGETATRRLELAARDTVRARGDTEGLTDKIQIASAELAGSLTQLAERLRPRRVASAVANRLRDRFDARPAPFLWAGIAVAVVLVLRSRRST